MKYDRENFDPIDSVGMQKLTAAVEASLKQLQGYKRNRNEAIKEFVGAHYSDGGTRTSNSKKMPLPLLELAVSIYSRQLVSGTPRALITTPYRELKPFSITFELALNNLIKTMGFKQTHKKIVKDAMFGMGIAKVGLNKSQTVKVGGNLHDYGQPFFDRVSLDDFVFDMQAGSWEEVQYMGNKYRIAKRDLLESGVFDEDQAEKVEPDGYTTIDDMGDTKAVELTRDNDPEGSEYEPMIEVWDMWLPRYNLFITYTANSVDDEGKPRMLRVVEWDGPDRGPYHILGFQDVPDNPLPLSPISSLRDLHNLSNSLWRKLYDQSVNQKKLTLVRNESGGDVRKLLEADNLEAIAVTNPDHFREIAFNGPDGPTLAFALQAQQNFDQLGGNLSTLGGLSTGADTATQEQLLMGASGQRLAEYADFNVDFVKNVVRDLGFYLWNDPLIEMPLVKRVPGFDRDFPVTWSPDQREGEYFDYNFDVAPYSMTEMTPQQRAAFLREFWHNDVMPLADVYMQAGAMPNVIAYKEMMAKHMNLPELHDLFIESNPTQPGLANKTPVRAPGGPRAAQTGGGKLPGPAPRDKGNSEAISAVLSRPEQKFITQSGGG